MLNQPRCWKLGRQQLEDYELTALETGILSSIKSSSVPLSSHQAHSTCQLTEKACFKTPSTFARSCSITLLYCAAARTRQVCSSAFSLLLSFLLGFGDERSKTEKCVYTYLRDTDHTPLSLTPLLKVSP